MMFNNSYWENLGSSRSLHSSMSPRPMLRLRGGGGDGGATGAESRDCYLTMYLAKKPAKVDIGDTRLAKWTRCRLSSDPLTPPCVIDHLGNIFNKESVVQALVAKTIPRGLGHIRGLKDIIDVHLQENLGDKRSGTMSRFVCSITGQEFNGMSKFFALRSCGHVLSAKAFKEVKSSTCLLCHVPFLEEDKIVINGSVEEVEVLRTRMEEEKAKKLVPRGKKKRDAAAVVPVDIGGIPDSSQIHVGGDATDSFPKVKDLKGGREAEAETGVGFNVSGPGISVRSDSVVRPKGSDLVVPSKRYKAGAHVPAGATKSVYSSIFTSSNKSGKQETYMCRSLPIARN